jgi:SAM-dependent methyltransferase
MFTRSASLYDVIYSFKDYVAEAETLRKLIERFKRSDGTDLLDVGCGTGGHVPHLRAHFTIEGLDLDPAMLEVARRLHAGVRFHQGDMTSFDLARRFDVVACLFSSIGYVRTVERLREAVRNMARHLRPGGVLVIEPWLTPESYQSGACHALFVDRPDLKIARVNVSGIERNVSVIDFHYLVGRPEGVEHFVERHELGLFGHEEYASAIEACGLTATFDPAGLTGRGLHLGVSAIER